MDRERKADWVGNGLLIRAQGDRNLPGSPTTGVVMSYYESKSQVLYDLERLIGLLQMCKEPIDKDKFAQLSDRRLEDLRKGVEDFLRIAG